MKRRRNLKRIDHIPHCRRRPRTAGSPQRRRTDFSLFFAYHKGLWLGSVNILDKLSTLTGFGKPRNKRKCSSSQDKINGLFSKFTEFPVIEVESVGQNALFQACDGRSFYRQNRIVRKLEFVPVTENINTCIAPGSVVWAKTAGQLWWPAEVMDEKSTAVDSLHKDVDGLALIQYFGNYQRAWVDPTRDLSVFNESFEERSCNAGNEFQNALEQALQQRKNRRLNKHPSGLSDDCSRSNQGDESPDKWNSSSSSRTESPCEGRRKSERERKPKLHFDEQALPLKLARGVRRFRIMRSLGLAPPDGSPF